MFCLATLFVAYLPWELVRPGPALHPTDNVGGGKFVLTGVEVFALAALGSWRWHEGRAKGNIVGRKLLAITCHTPLRYL